MHDKCLGGGKFKIWMSRILLKNALHYLRPIEAHTRGPGPGTNSSWRIFYLTGYCWELAAILAALQKRCVSRQGAVILVLLLSFLLHLTFVLLARSSSPLSCMT